LCSDGIWDGVSLGRILSLTRNNYNPEFICRIANRNICDDCTAIIITKQKMKTSLHTSLFKLFSKSPSSSSISSDEGCASPQFLKISMN